MHHDVVRGQYPTPADDVGSALTLPRKRWRHSGNPPVPLKNPDGTHVPSEKKAERTRKRWFDSRISSHSNNCLCPTQIPRLLHFLETGWQKHRCTHPRQLFFPLPREREREQDKESATRELDEQRCFFFLRILLMERHHRFIRELASVQFDRSFIAQNWLFGSEGKILVRSIDSGLHDITYLSWVCEEIGASTESHDVPRANI